MRNEARPPGAATQRRKDRGEESTKRNIVSRKESPVVPLNERKIKKEMFSEPYSEESDRKEGEIRKNLLERRGYGSGAQKTSGSSPE